MYRCESCGAIFADPRRVVLRENLDGERGYETRAVESCPWCGEEWLEEAEDAT